MSQCLHRLSRILIEMARGLVGIAIALVALGVGGSWIYGSINRRRMRTEDQMAAYRSAGGVVMTGFELGCGGAIIFAGLVLMGAALWTLWTLRT